MKRRRDMAEVQAQLIASQAKPVKLRVAASVVYNELNRRGRASMRGPEYLEALTAAAARLAQVADVYHVVHGKLMRIPDEELEGGAFADGGNLFRSASGTIYKSLSVRRIDVLQGIEVLRKAQKTLEDAADAAPQTPQRS